MKYTLNETYVECRFGSLKFSKRQRSGGTAKLADRFKRLKKERSLVLMLVTDYKPYVRHFESEKAGAFSSISHNTHTCRKVDKTLLGYR